MNVVNIVVRLTSTVGELGKGERLTHEALFFVAIILAVIVVVFDIQRGKRAHLRELDVSDDPVEVGEHPAGPAHSVVPAVGGVGVVEPPERLAVEQAIVVNESPAMRVIIGCILEENGYRVAEAGNGREALAQLVEFTSSSAVLVVVDFDMPDMDGLEFIRAVRSELAFGAVRIVMLAAASRFEHAGTELEMLADECLEKPFAKAPFLEKLELLGLRP